MGLEIGKHLKNKIMKSKAIQNMVHIKSDKNKKEHNIKRNSLFSKIRSKVNDFRKKINKTTTSPQEKGEAIADIIEPITHNIECLDGIKTEADFKKEFFRSLCGNKFSENETDPAAFFARHPELSIRKEALHNRDIDNIVGLFEDTTTPEIKTAFTNKFPKTVKDSANNDISQGELLTRYIKEIDSAIKKKSDEKIKFDDKKGASDAHIKISASLEIISSKLEKANLEFDSAQKKFTALKLKSDRLNEIEQDLKSQKTSPEEVSKKAVQNLQNIIANLSASADFLIEKNKTTIQDIDSLYQTIDKTFKKAEEDFKKSMTQYNDFMSSEEYKKNTEMTKDMIAKNIVSLENLYTQHDDLLEFARTAQRFAEDECKKNPTNKKAETQHKNATAHYDKINARKTDIENKLTELRLQQTKLEKISQEEALKQHIIAESQKLVDIFDLPENITKNEQLIESFHKSLDDAFKDIPDDAGKTQALENAFRAIQNTLPPLKILTLIAGLSEYQHKIDAALLTPFEKIMPLFDHLHTHITPPPHAIDLNALSDRQPVILFASSNTEHKAINITKIGTDITITTHDFPDDTKNAQTYTLHDTQIGDAQNYLNEILKEQKTTYPDFVNIHTSLDKLTKEKEIASPPPPTDEIDVTKATPLLEDYWTLDDAKQSETAEKFKEILPKWTKKDTKDKAIDTYVKTLSPLDEMAFHNIMQDGKMAVEITQRKALRDIVIASTDTAKPIEFDKIKNMPRRPLGFTIGATDAFSPFIIASDDKNEHLKINISKSYSGHISIAYQNFSDSSKKSIVTKVDASQVGHAENYINALYKKENTENIDLDEVKNTIASFAKKVEADYKTPENTKIPLTNDVIDRIHDALYETGRIENYWIALHETDSANKDAIKEKFNDLFPRKEIYDAFYQDPKKDGQPLTTLAIQYLAHEKWNILHPDTVPALEILHEGMSRLFKPNTHPNNTIILDEIFKEDGDAILLDFTNNPTAPSANSAHYTGALIRRNAENNYTITTINTTRTHDNEYTLNATDDIKHIISEIYAKSTKGKSDNPANAIPKTTLAEIETLLNKPSIPTEPQTIQTGLRCGIDVVQRAMNFLTIAENDAETKVGEEEVIQSEDNNDAKKAKILRNTHNILQRKISHFSIGDMIIPHQFIFDRYINPSDSKNSEAKHNTSTQKIKNIFTSDISKTLFGNEAEYINTYIADYQETHPITAIALLDYQNQENYKPLMQSMQAGRKAQDWINKNNPADSIISPFKFNEPTTFLFKTEDAPHTAMTIIPTSDATYRISFINSQNHEQEIFEIPNDKKDTIEHTLSVLIKLCSEKLKFNSYISATFPPTLNPTRISEELEKLKTTHLTRLENKPLDATTSYLNNINSFIRDISHSS